MLIYLIKKNIFFINCNGFFHSLNNNNFNSFLLINFLNINYRHNFSHILNQYGQLNFNQNKQFKIFINNKFSRRNPAKIIYALCFLFLEGAYFDS